MEVSSPGLDRPLSKLSHFKDIVGEKIKLRFSSSHGGGAKGVTGVLREVMENGVVVEPDHLKEEKITVLFAEMAEAHVIFDFSEMEKHKKPKAKK